MTDDDFRDDFGDKLTDALRARSRTDAAPETAALAAQHDARSVRTRRRVLTSVVALVIIIGAISVFADQDHAKSRVNVATTPTTVPVAAGMRVVSYRGVHVEVPASWPVVDGMHTAFCGGPFPETPTAFVGPNENFAPSCPVRVPDRRRFAASVWLQPRDRPSDARRVVTRSGQTLLEEPLEPTSSVRQFWYRGVSITVGVGHDSGAVTAIINSIGFDSATPDTPASGVCTRSDNVDVMPTPERLAEKFVVEQGSVTMNPPRASDEPTMTAAQAWDQAGPKQDFERYRVILTRYSSPLPAHLNPDGSETPFDQDRLAWVVYAAPLSPAIQGCGTWVINLFDAVTAKSLEIAIYGNGP